MNDDPAEEIRRFLIDFIGTGEISLDDELIRSHRLTSLDIQSLKIFLEKRFGVDVPATEITEAQFSTVRSMAELVCKLLDSSS